MSADWLARNSRHVCGVFPPVSRPRALLAGVEIDGVPRSQRMEDLTLYHNGCCDGVAILQRQGTRRMGPAAVYPTRFPGGPPDASGWGGRPVLCHPEGYRPAPLPAVGEPPSTSSGAVNQPYCPLHCS